MKKGILAGLTISIATAGNLPACLWDRDTLAQEGKGIPDVIRVITGRFERNPPRYYRMRLTRVEEKYGSAAIEEKLALCDDGGVACDRLHKSRDAIRWMQKKNALLDSIKEDEKLKAEHLYRYHANLGTFIVHEWLRDGAMDGQIHKLRQARDHISKAIEINPTAHFDREKYQMMAMDWIHDQMNAESDSNTFVEFPSGLTYKERRAAAKAATEGVTGLIVLGDAWQSIDAYNSLAYALAMDKKSSVAYLTFLRILELQDAGKKSLVLTGKIEPDKYAWDIRGTPLEKLRQFFTEARAEAEQWQQARSAYMEYRFKFGEHPDTHPDFWKEFKESTQPPVRP